PGGPLGPRPDRGAAARGPLGEAPAVGHPPVWLAGRRHWAERPVRTWSAVQPDARIVSPHPDGGAAVWGHGAVCGRRQLHGPVWRACRPRKSRPAGRVSGAALTLGAGLLSSYF